MNIKARTSHKDIVLLRIGRNQFLNLSAKLPRGESFRRFKKIYKMMLDSLNTFLTGLSRTNGKSLVDLTRVYANDFSIVVVGQIHGQIGFTNSRGTNQGKQDRHVPNVVIFTYKMKNLKHIIAIIIVLVTIIATVVVILPKFAESGLVQGLTQNEETPAEEVAVEETVVDTIPFKEALQQELQAVNADYSKRKNKHIWTLGRGQSIITYLLQAQRFVDKKGGKVLYMEELHNTKVLQAANVIILQPDQDTLHVEFQVSDRVFRDDASAMAVVFTVKDLPPEIVEELNKLDYPFTLAIPPFGVSNYFYPNMDKINNAELDLWLTLESVKLNAAHNKLRPLRIHHTEEQIEAVINEAKALIPSAKGVVSREGEQAVEHEHLMQAILKPAKKNHLWFVDATMNGRSKVSDVCKKLEISCKNSTRYNPDNRSLDDYIKQQLREARKSGLSTMVIPLEMKNLNKIKDLAEKAKSQGTSLVYLSKFMEY